jgi:RNA polymerase sigma factor (sigma-70 family)
VQLIADQQFLDQIQAMRDKIFRITKRMLVSQEEAEDATQDVIVKLWSLGSEKRDRYKSMEAYTVTMAKNYCLAQVLSFDDSIRVPKTLSLQKEIELTDELNWVTQLIDQLPEKEKMIIQLREIEHYDFDQIATILEIPEGTVRVYLSRIRKKLRKQFLEIQNHGL